MTPRRSAKLTHRPPDPDELKRLEPYAKKPSGGASQLKDPITGNIYSARQVQKARSGGLGPEQVSRIKRAGFSELAQSAKAAFGSNTVPYLAERYAAKTGKRVSQILTDKKFLSAVNQLHRAGEKQTGARSARARALAKLGLRSWKDQHRVGGSPRRKK